MSQEREDRIILFAESVASDVKDRASFFSSTGSLIKNTDYTISATKKIIYVSVFNPISGRLISVQPTLAADRLSGTIKITQTITNAEISIITQ